MVTGKKFEADFYDRDYFVPRQYFYEVVCVLHAGDKVAKEDGTVNVMERDGDIIARDLEADRTAYIRTDQLDIPGGIVFTPGMLFGLKRNSKLAFPRDPSEQDSLGENTSHLKTIVGLEPHARVLEIGSAFGFLVKLLISEGIYAEGCDISKYAIDNCVVDKTLIKQCDIRDGIPYGSWSFDVVIASNVLEHVDPQYIDAVIKDMCRISTKWVIIQVPVSMSMKNEPIGDMSHVLYMHPSFWISKLYENEYLIDWGRSYCNFEIERGLKWNIGYFVFYKGSDS